MSIKGDCEVDRMDISHTTSLIIASSDKDSQLRLWDYCNPEFNATAESDVMMPRVQFSIDGSEFIVSPLLWVTREEDRIMERWEISQSPLGLRCLGREPYDPDQPLTERSPELPHHFCWGDQWVIDREGRRVCWISPEWRLPVFDVSESKFVALDSGRMLILDLANVVRS